MCILYFPPLCTRLQGLDFVCPGTDRARDLAQTLLNVPYGEGDGEKLDVYIPKGSPLGTTTLKWKFGDPESQRVFTKMKLLLFQMFILSFTYMEATGSFSGTPLCSLCKFLQMLIPLWGFSCWFIVCFWSKEESGFMAVPLVDKGVVVVAVGYDIAPKGTTRFHWNTLKNCAWKVS